nr:hypothetical protein [Myxococcota bacterium]
MARIKSTGFWVCSFLLIGALGCEGGGDKKCPGGICDVPTIDYGAPDPSDDSGSKDTSSDPRSDLEAIDEEGVTDDDLTPGDKAPTDLPGEGEFLSPCEENSDCYSGFCMSTLNGKVCTELCIESCPHPDWKCERVAPPGSEPVYACVPPNSALCRPCANDIDCQFIEGEEGARCIEYGPQGRFCAVECSSSEGIGCQEGFKCQQLKIGGEPIELCMSKQNDCPCLMGFVGLSTRCYNFNEHGTCTGDRVCRLQGMEYAWDDCTARVPAPEECNGIDDNCNGYIDEDMGEFMCGLGVCAHLVPECINGQPGVCNQYKGQSAEICDKLDNDCDGETDELWPELGQPCDGPDPDECKNGVFVCNAAGDGVVCEGDFPNFEEVCNGIDDDCDGLTDEDLGTQTCGIGACEHTIDNCVGGRPQTCNPMEGYQPDDPPDPDYIDSNCDGIDGDASKAIFVDASSGRDTNPGTRENPKKTIQAGLNAAASQGKLYVLVSLGVYNETVELRNGVGLYGQYDASADWQRKVENTTTIRGNSNKGIIAENIASKTHVQGFVVISESTSERGGSSYGIFATNSPGLELHSMTIQAGNGGRGENGVGGQNGLNGSMGGQGTQGCGYNCGCLICINQCGDCPRPLGGDGGDSVCGVAGGNGGNSGGINGLGFSGQQGQGLNDLGQPSGGYGGAGGASEGNGMNGGAGLPGFTGLRGINGLPDGTYTSSGYV